jgi:hypothetical protein
MAEDTGEKEGAAAENGTGVPDAGVGDPRQVVLVTGMHKAISGMANHLGDMHRILMALAEESGTRLPGGRRMSRGDFMLRLTCPAKVKKTCFLLGCPAK